MGTHTHWWGSPKVMGGEFKEENKPEPWELSPYELGREYAYHHRVSGKTAAWIVAYCVALIWAVLEGAVTESGLGLRALCRSSLLVIKIKR